MLHVAGFTVVKLSEEDDEVWFENPAEAWAFNLDMGPFPVMLRQQLTDGQRRELEQRFAGSLQGLMTDRGIRCTFHLLYALAEKGR
jgi:hypothetical protein